MPEYDPAAPARRRILGNSILGFIASLSVRAAGALLFLLLARTVGAGPAGVFSLGTTYLAVFGAVLWGLDEITVREVARDPAATGRYFSGMVGVRLVLGALTMGAMVWMARSAGYAESTASFLAVFALSLVADGVSAALQALFHAHQRLGVPMVIGLVVMGVKLGGGAWALFGPPGAPWAGTGLDGVARLWVAGSAMGAALYLLAAFALLRVRAAPPWRIEWDWWGRVLRLSVPFTVIAVVTILDWQSDVLLLSFLKSEREVGWYSAAFTIFATLWMIPQAYRVAVYPEMARLQATAPGRLGGLYTRSMRLMLLLVLPVATGLWLLAPGIVRLLYKDGFDPSVPALQLLGLALVPLFLNVSGVRLLVVKERTGLLAWYVALGLAVNIAANLVLIPTQGTLGAAIARVLSTVVFFVLHYQALRRYVPLFDFWRTAWRPALATAGMALGVLVVREYSFWGALAIGVALYAGFAWWWVADADERNSVRVAVRAMFGGRSPKAEQD